jgi:Formin Homology 2 Domain/Subunit CCDC53 of WASH complex
MRVNLKPVKRDRPTSQPEMPIAVPLAKMPGATAEHPIIVDTGAEIRPELSVPDTTPKVMIMDVKPTVAPPDRNQRPIPPPKKKFGDCPEDDTLLLLPLQKDEGYGESIVLLGKQTIKNIRGSLDSKPMEDAIVNWSIDRNEIEPDGINLSMAIFCIILLLNNGEQVEILFQNSDDCVRFVSAFYEVTSVPPVPPEVSDNMSVNSSVRGLESLNDEEQSVLERYRELRQTKPPMKALAETLSEDCDPTPTRSGPFDARHGLLQELLLQKSSSSEGTTTAATDASKNGFPEVVSTPDLPSSPVSTFTATSDGLKSFLNALNDDEKAIAKKYDLMLKRGVPIEAVQHSLTNDGVDSKIVDFVLSESGATKVDESEHDEIIKKYKQMTKMGIPVDAVMHKMVKDGVDEPTMAIVLKALDITEEMQAENATAIQQSRKGKLSPSEEIEVAKYRKLLKLQVSREALLSRMQNEKVNDKIIEAVLGKFAQNQNKAKKMDDESTCSKLINLHWNPMDDVPAGSVWEQGQSSLNLEKSDINSLVEQFQKKPASSRQGPEPTDKPNYTVKAKILDVTRANNVAISLKAFKDFSYKELAEIIGFLDPCRKILGERAQFIRDLLPTAQEAISIAKYDGPDDRMGPAEQWFRRLEGIKRLDTKAQVIRTMEFFSSEASEIRNNFRLLSQVCSQIQRSTKLVDVLKMVLKIGNTMNEGTRSGGAAGFRFDSLLRLTQTKTTDGKMSVLDYMVSVFVEKGQRDKLDLLSDFPELHAASRFLIVDMQNEVKMLGAALALCKEEHKAMASDLESKTKPPQLNKPEQAATGDAKKALLASIIAQGEKAAEQQKIDQFTKRDDFLAAIDTKRKVSEDVASDAGSRRSSNSRIENNFQGGMTRLRQFIDSVDDSFARLVKQKDEALECSRDLAKFCGEAGGVGATGSLLDILAKFTRNVESALRSFDERLVRLSTKKKRDDSRQSLEEQSMEVPHQDGRSLILMVNDVLKSANPSFKEDFKKGRKLPNPSEALKAIYQKETALSSHDTNRESMGGSDYEESSCCSATLAATASTDDSTFQSMSLHTPTNRVPSPTNTEVIGAAMAVIRCRAAIEQSSLHKPDDGMSNSVSLSARALQKRQQRTMTTPPKTIDEEVSAAEKANPCESSTARLARMKRIQKRLGSG